MLERSRYRVAERYNERMGYVRELGRQNRLKALPQKLIPKHVRSMTGVVPSIHEHRVTNRRPSVNQGGLQWSIRANWERAAEITWQTYIQLTQA